MDLTLKRHEYGPQGVFGVLYDSQGVQIAETLEHAYDDGQGGWIPKVAPGTYTCVRHAPNRLPYETFLVQDVPDFQGSPVSGILLHKGNFDRDSAGCILVGTKEADVNGTEMVTQSKLAFDKLMDLQAGVDSFVLEVVI